MKEFERVARWTPAVLALLLIAGLAFFGELAVSVQGGSSSTDGKSSPPNTEPSPGNSTDSGKSGGSTSSSSSGGSTSASSSSSGGSSSSSSSSSGDDYSQTNPFDAAHAFELQINGHPTTISGTDHAIDGTVKTDQSKAVPAVGVVGVNGEYVNGTVGDTVFSGIAVDGQHDDSQIEGGMVNNLLPKDADLERFIQSVKNSAHYTIDLSQSNPDAVSTSGGTAVAISGGNAGVGSATDFKIVYARGTKNADGTVNENNLHISGNGTSYGIMLVEIDNPDQAAFIMSGGYKWVGLILVVYNKRPTDAKTLYELTGGGNDMHLVGGAMVYLRNNGNTVADPGDIYGQEFYRTNGTSDLKFSRDALDQAVDKVEVSTSVKIRSWRKLE